MKKFLLLLALVAIGTSIAAQEGPANILTAKEKSAGWKLLFDGTTLNNFVPQGKAQWKVVDGALRPEGAGGWLATKDDYTNFQLQVAFRTSAPNINSGIFLRRGRQDGTRTRLAMSCRSGIRLPEISLTTARRITTTPTTPAAFPAI